MSFCRGWRMGRVCLWPPRRTYRLVQRSARSSRRIRLSFTLREMTFERVADIRGQESDAHGDSARFPEVFWVGEDVGPSRKDGRYHLSDSVRGAVGPVLQLFGRFRIVFSVVLYR